MGIGDGGLDGVVVGDKLGMELGIEVGADEIDGNILGVELGLFDGEKHDGRNILISNNFELLSYVRISKATLARLASSIMIMVPDQPSAPS